MGDLDRLLRPKSIAVVGGGAWCANVIAQCEKIGFTGAIWPVHPKRTLVGGLGAFPSVSDLPEPPDATFIGVNRTTTVEVVAQLSAMGAGGAVCFASGFAEAAAELEDAADLQGDLLRAAGEMAILGPNCYGFINALDAVALWPDQHGAMPVDRGVALITQSSNIAINLTMQARGLPIAYVMTAGNQAQQDIAALGRAALSDPRVTALGLHIEGIADRVAFEDLAREAHALGKPIVALKIGASDQARAATVSHTASMAGSDVGARAFLARCGVAQVGSLSALLETLKLLHVVGPLRSNRIASMSCSGGEASLMADSALAHNLFFPPLDPPQRTALRAALGPKVALANPLDYHTYIWNHLPAMTATFRAMMGADLAMGLVVLDFPRADRCDDADWLHVIEAVAAVDAPMGIVASLPDTMPERHARTMIARGITPFAGIDDALTALDRAAWLGRSAPGTPVWAAPTSPPARPLSEGDGKAALATHGLRLPRSERTRTPEATTLPMPIALKGEGIAHKTEAGAVALNLSTPEAIAAAAAAMPTDTFLVEEMITGTVAELLLAITADPVHGYVLTLGAGGTLAELWADTTTLMLPVSDTDIRTALTQLRIAPLLAGYRGAPSANTDAIVCAVRAVQAYVDTARPIEVEINPLICTPMDAIAVDVLITPTEAP